MYAQNTTASKNLLQINMDQARKLANHKNDKAMLLTGISPLFRKLLICEQVTKRNHTTIELMHALAASGFNATPQILYSDND